MAIVTAAAGDERDGCLIGFSTQCSIDPTRFLACLSNANLTRRIAARASLLVVHVLHAGAHDEALARLFGEETGFETDKLTRCEWEAGPEGAPVLAGCDWFAGTIVDRVDLGDHTGFVLDVREDLGAAARAAEPPLTFVDLRALDAGRDASRGAHLAVEENDQVRTSGIAGPAR